MSMLGFVALIGTVSIANGVCEGLKQKKHELSVNFTAPEDVTAEVTVSCPQDLEHYEIKANQGEVVIPVHGFSKYEFCINEITGSSKEYKIPKPKTFRFFGNKAYNLNLV